MLSSPINFRSIQHSNILIYIRNNSNKLVFIIIIVFAICKLLISYYFQDTALTRGNSHTALISIAENIANHHFFSVRYPIISIDYEPLYPFLIGLSFKIFGINWFSLALLNTIIASISGWFFYLISRMITNNIIGVFTTIYYLFYPYYFLYSISVFDTNLFLLLLLALLFFLINNNGGFIAYLKIGITLGLLILTRGSIIALLPAIFIFNFYNDIIVGKNFKKFLYGISIIFLLSVLTVSPWIARNYLLTEKIIISTHGPFGFWQGNNKLSYNYINNDVSLDKTYKQSPLPEIVKKYPIIAREPRASIKVSNAYKEEALKFIKNNQKEFLTLTYIKFIKFWSPIRTPKSTKLAYGSNQLRQYFYFISYFPLLLLFPFGLILLYKEQRNIFFLFFSILIFYTLAHMIVMGFTRARLPIDIILIISVGFLLFKVRQTPLNKNEI